MHLSAIRKSYEQTTPIESHTEALVTSPTDAIDSARFLAPGEGVPIWFLRNRMTIKATAATTGGAFGLVESLIAPGFSPPLHVHHRDDESFWVLEGDVTMRCGNRTFRASPGSF